MPIMRYILPLGRRNPAAVSGGYLREAVHVDGLEPVGHAVPVHNVQVVYHGGLLFILLVQDADEEGVGGTNKLELNCELVGVGGSFVLTRSRPS